MRVWVPLPAQVVGFRGAVSYLMPLTRELGDVQRFFDVAATVE